MPDWFWPLASLLTGVLGSYITISSEKRSRKKDEREEIERGADERRRLVAVEATVTTLDGRFERILLRLLDANENLSSKLGELLAQRGSYLDKRS